MKRPYLEATFRGGRPLAAYLYLPRPARARAARTVELRPGLLVDFGPDGAPIGVELTDPSHVEVAQLNEVLSSLGVAPMLAADLAPLRAA